MSFIKEQFMEAGKLLSINVGVLEKNDASDIVNGILAKFASIRSSQDTIWEHLNCDKSIYDPKGWSSIKSFTYIGEVIVFFEQQTDQAVLRVPGFIQLEKILANCTGFVFYVTNSDLDFVVCHNDHDYLIGAGIAKDWISSLYKQS